jgi:hypothetical protein
MTKSTNISDFIYSLFLKLYFLSKITYRYPWMTTWILHNESKGCGRKGSLTNLRLHSDIWMAPLRRPQNWSRGTPENRGWVLTARPQGPIIALSDGTQISTTKVNKFQQYNALWELWEMQEVGIIKGVIAEWISNYYMSKNSIASWLSQIWILSIVPSFI